MIRYLKQYKLLLFLTVLFTAISSLSYVFIAILLQQVMDIVDMGNMDGFIRILLFSLVYFALMGVFMYLQSLFSKKFVCKIMKTVRSKTFIGIERHTIEDYSKNNTADYLSAITNDVKMIEDNYLLPLLQVIQYTIIFIASLAVMIYFDIMYPISFLYRQFNTWQNQNTFFSPTFLQGFIFAFVKFIVISNHSNSNTL